jgi:hypothetical protein
MTRPLIAVVFWAATTAGSLLAQTAIHTWEIFEVQSAPNDRIVFRGVSGEAAGKTHEIRAFHDGGERWRARFAPSAAGDWEYNGNQTKGKLRVVPWTEAEKRENPTRRGFVYVARDGPRTGRHFVYADGTPFLWIGDTWWNWSKKGIHFATFAKLVDNRAARGFTVGQIFFPGDPITPDPEQVRQMEQFVSYANSKGITVWLHGWWTRKGMSETVSPERVRGWWQYLVRRFGAYNVIWVLAGEYNMHNYGGYPLQFWKELGAMIRAEDPYRRIIGTHPTPPLWQGGADAPQWSTGEVLHNEEWLDYNQSQVGHGKPRQEMIPQVVAADYLRKPAKPVVVTEPWYEFMEGNPSAEDIRFGAWSAILSGAAGHSYGGGHVWWAHVPEAPAKVAPWPIEASFDVNTLDYPGAVSMGFMARFLKGIKWWLLEPRPDLVHDYPARYCAAVPGLEYVVYVRWAGGLRLDLRPSSESDEFRLTWTDLSDGVSRPSTTLRGGAIREIGAPEGYPPKSRFSDWLLHVVKVR